MTSDNPLWSDKELWQASGNGLGLISLLDVISSA